MLPRTLYDADHDIFRQAARKFIDQEILPYHDQWEKDGVVSRTLWERAGAAGLLCMTIPEEYGGAGGQFRHSSVFTEELSRANVSGPGFGVHSDICAPYILNHGTEAQKKHWLPKMAAGQVITAIAMSEPDAGSDLQAIKTSAIRDGDHYVLNGSKTFVTNGQLADLIVVVTKTDPSQGARGISLMLVEADREGVKRGRNLEKVGLKAQDTSEVFFEDVRVPVSNRLGAEGRGFVVLMQELPRERLLIAVGAIAAAEAALEWTVDYTKERRVFGQAVADFQNTRFRLAELYTEIQIGRIFVDRCIGLIDDGKLDTVTASMAKYWTTDLQCKMVDTGVQFHGGYGYMWEYPIARAFADSRVQRIYGGSNEIMKELISRDLLGK